MTVRNQPKRSGHPLGSDTSGDAGRCGPSFRAELIRRLEGEPWRLRKVIGMLLEKACSGDPGAIRLIMESLDGFPVPDDTVAAEGTKTLLSINELAAASTKPSK